MAAKKSPPAKPEPEAPEASENKQPLDGVFVAKVRDEDGNIRTQVILNGKIEPTEVQTVLELGILGWREQIGLARP